MTLTTLCTAIRDALAASSALSAKCSELYGAAPVIIYGSDRADPPATASAPALVIMPEGKSRGENEAVRTYMLTVGLAVTQETREGTGGVTEYQCISDMEAILDIVAREVRNLSPELTLEGEEYAFDAVEYYPQARATLSLVVTVPVLIGGYEPTL